jgi:hypothetical protein
MGETDVAYSDSNLGMVTERRRHSRISIYHPISYVGIDENGNILEQQIGIALDISQSGILIESIQEVESTSLIIMAVGTSKNLIEIKGTVAYCRSSGKGKFNVGVSFQGSREDKIQFAKKIVKAYYYQNKLSPENQFYSAN